MVGYYLSISGRSSVEGFQVCPGRNEYFLFFQYSKERLDIRARHAGKMEDSAPQATAALLFVTSTLNTPAPSSGGRPQVTGQESLLKRIERIFVVTNILQRIQPAYSMASHEFSHTESVVIREPMLPLQNPCLL
eukprot:gb/GECG01001215.1/.p1 GENE.gb/GECG01001215.1/~~gb/GECG01001215.1/.p1  ORF type:complete len:134 (+),score=12.05 gb/GECG01001215.1/:1-402(+)